MICVECSVRLGGSREKAREVYIPDDDSWEYTLIGSQNAWIEEISVPEHLETYRKRGLHTTQIYQGEDICIDGSKRTTVVLYECGEREEIAQFLVGMGRALHRRKTECATTRWSSDFL